MVMYSTRGGGAHTAEPGTAQHVLMLTSSADEGRNHRILARRDFIRREKKPAGLQFGESNSESLSCV
jgi:hypothetical protein